MHGPLNVKFTNLHYTRITSKTIIGFSKNFNSYYVPSIYRVRPLNGKDQHFNIIDTHGRDFPKEVTFVFVDVQI